MDCSSALFKNLIFACIVSSALSGTSANIPISNFGNDSKKRYNLESSRFAFGALHSLRNLSMWAAHEEQIVKELRRRKELLELEIKFIEDYLADYHSSSKEALKHVHEPKVSGNERGAVIGSSAVLSHRMIARYTSSIRLLKEMVQSEEYRGNQGSTTHVLETPYWDDEITAESMKDITGNVNTSKLKFLWPSWEDKYMSSLAFLHLQAVNGYLPEDLQYGPHFDTAHGGELNAGHCTEIGVFALRKGYYYMGVEWLERARILTVNNELLSRDVSESLLDLAIQESNFQLKYVTILDELLKTNGQVAEDDPAIYEEYSKLYGNIYVTPYYRSMAEEDKNTGRNSLYHFGKERSDTEEHAYQLSRYMDVCMGFHNQDIKIQSKLKCYYENSRHPYLYINPVKAEQLSESPPIYQFYEMVGDSEIERIKNERGRNLSLSSVVGYSDYESITDYRTSAGVGFYHDYKINAIKLADKITDLEVVNSDELTQYGEYTYGRYYSYHADWFPGAVEPAENRLATILYYLELPELGGLTPFCSAELAAHPVRGSAILWYSMYRNGSIREDVNHGACPVVHGHKIIMNQGVLYGGNFQKLKCSLNRYE